MFDRFCKITQPKIVRAPLELIAEINFPAFSTAHKNWKTKSGRGSILSYWYTTNKVQVYPIANIAKRSYKLNW